MGNILPTTNLTLLRIGSDLGLPGPSYPMNLLIGKNVYLADGTRIPVTQSDLNFGFLEENILLHLRLVH